MFLWQLSWQRPGLPVATQKWQATWPSLRDSRARSKVRLGVVMACGPSSPHSVQGTEYTAGTAGGQRHGEVVAWRHGRAAGLGSPAAVSYLISLRLSLLTGDERISSPGASLPSVHPLSGSSVLTSSCSDAFSPFLLAHFILFFSTFEEYLKLSTQNHNKDTRAHS